MSDTELEENWKDKYFKALMEQDDAEKASEERFEQVVKELLHAFGHFKGQDQAVDDALNDLSEKTNLETLEVSILQDLNRQIADVIDNASGVNINEQASSETQLSNANVNPYEVAKDSLNHLVENFPSDVTNQLDIKQLKSSLQSVDSIDTLQAVADELKNAVTTVLNDRNKKVKELSNFLGSVAKRLNTLQSHLKDEKSDRKNSSADRGDLGKLVGNNLQELRESVAEAESVDVMQKEIESRIEIIDNSVISFIETETLRAKKAENSSADLEAQLDKMKLQSDQLRQSLEAARTEAVVDPLTGVSNRRAYDERFEVEYARWKRNHEPLTLAIIDIDKFKSINDTYGHPIGDKVLKVVAGRIQQQVRESDFFGRIGGEEFAFILVNSNLKNALEKVEQLRQSVAECNFRIKKKKFQVTISIGLATFKGRDTIETIYSRADQALVEAKQTGRNKTLTELDIANEIS